MSGASRIRRCSPAARLPVAPSAIAPAGQAWTLDGMKPYVTPHALETGEIAGIVEDFRRGARNARQAGFDGVELHGANGYLIDQFLRDGTNRRSDGYGGSAENRARFLVEVTEAIVGEWGGERVGVRLSPTNPYNDIADSNPAATFAAAVGALAAVRPCLSAHRRAGGERSRRRGRNAGPKILPQDLARRADRQQGLRSRCAPMPRSRDGTADLIAFATLYLANPDLPERFRRGGPFNPPDRKTFYGGGGGGLYRLSGTRRLKLRFQPTISAAYAESAVL